MLEELKRYFLILLRCSLSFICGALVIFFLVHEKEMKYVDRLLQDQAEMIESYKALCDSSFELNQKQADYIEEMRGHIFWEGGHQ